MDACSQTHTYMPNTEPERTVSVLHLPETTIQPVAERGMGGGEKGRQKGRTERNAEGETKIGKEKE